MKVLATGATGQSAGLAVPVQVRSGPRLRAGVHDPTSSIEVGDERFEVTATELHGAERDRMFASQAARYPGFVGYQRKTQRVIPVLALTPVLSHAFPQQMNKETSS